MAQSQLDYIPQKRWWLKPLLALALVGVLGYGGQLAYRRWEPERLARQARVFLDNGEPGNALLSLRRALQLDPESEAASRAMAEITSRLNTPIALDWHRRLLELNPGSASDAFAWAGTAVRLGHAGSAEQALAAVPAREQGTARFQALRGTAALQAGKAAEAERAFTEAHRLEPGQELHRCNLATLHLQSPDLAKRAAARATLEELARGGSMQTVARRALVTSLLGEGDFAAALTQSDPLQESGEGRFSDRIAHLQLLTRARPEATERALSDAMKRAPESAEDAALLIAWMNANRRGPEALQWAETLGAPVAASGPVAMARAEVLLGGKDWEGLRRLCTSGEWGALEHLRHAFLARAARELRDDSAARAHWKTASVEAGRDRASAIRLASVARQWGWTDAYREALWTATASPAPQWALQRLHESYRAAGDSAGLLRTAVKTLDLEPENLSAQNNVAMLSLLRGEKLEDALREARELHAQAPRDPGFASTYAFALHMHGRTAEAIDVLEVLGEAALKTPGIAAYYGVLLSAVQKHGAAKPYLDAARSATLLPEEKALLAKALIGAGTPSDPE